MIQIVSRQLYSHSAEREPKPKRQAVTSKEETYCGDYLSERVSPPLDDTGKIYKLILNVLLDSIN